MHHQEIIRAENIVKNYGNVSVLKGVDLSVASGEIVAVTGSSGAGKTTLLQIIGSLESPDSGRVSIDGKDIFSLDKNALAAFRNNTLGFVFQFHHLLPEFTALENICIPAFIRGDSRKEAEERAAGFMDFLKINMRKDNAPTKEDKDS